MIMLVSGIVLICVFVLTLVICILRIVNKAPHRVISAITMSCVAIIADESSNADQPAFANKVTSTSDAYTRAEDVTKLIIELIFILFAIIATFVLYRYAKGKYAAVPTGESKPS
jgi:ribose/xylose/arabinose/galactoside ABC-type transport system permease subunit